MATTRPRWRAATRDDIKARRRVMLKSGRKGTVRRVFFKNPFLVLVAVDGHNLGDERYDQCVSLSALRVPNRQSA